MAVTSYPTPLNATSTDIELVGGKDAFIGMLREDKNGYRYVLHRIATGETVGNAAWVGGKNASLGVATTDGSELEVIIGANTTGKTVAAGQYFWCMVYGVYDMTCNSTVTNAYLRVTGAQGLGNAPIASDRIGQRESGGMSLEAVSARISGKARCLIDPRSGG